MIDEIAAIVNAHSLATVGTRRALVDDRGRLLRTGRELRLVAGP